MLRLNGDISSQKNLVSGVEMVLLVRVLAVLISTVGVATSPGGGLYFLQ